MTASSWACSGTRSCSCSRPRSSACSRRLPRPRASASRRSGRSPASQRDRSVVAPFRSARAFFLVRRPAVAIGPTRPDRTGAEILRTGHGFAGAARALVVASVAAAFLVAAAPAPADVERQVEDLLARMTLEEKVGQLNLVSAGPEYRPEMVTSGRVGAVINFNDAPDVAAVQRLARQSRLKIPLLVSLDILHGFRTTFPVPLAAAATFDPDLVRRAATAQARETAAMGVQWTFAPMVDISRDPRWGRIVEGAGEDPFLGSAMAAAQVEGFKAGGLATSPKHFAGYGAPEGGRDYDAAQIPPGELRDAFLPPFRAALRAGSDTIMAALTALNGVPAGVNRWLLTDVLPGEWGFDGFVVSDWAGLQEVIGDGVAGKPAEAARKAARGADLVVAVMGEPRDMSGEAASRALLGLPGKQADLVEALLATGKPVVLVLLGGRPITLGTLAERIPAVLMTWYPGTEGGHAVADVLFGDESPSGKPPVTWLRSAGQAPLFYNRLPTGRPTLPNNRFTLNYIDEAITPLYPFGWGLSYTRFTYGDAAIVKRELSAGEALEVSVTVTNAGA